MNENHDQTNHDFYIDIDRLLFCVGHGLSHGLLGIMAGGGSLIMGIDKMIAESTRMPVWITDEPMAAVVRGCGKLLTDEKLLKKVKVGARNRY